MKQFFKFVFASMLGTILSGVVLFILFFVVMVGVVATSMSDLKNKDKMVTVEANSVLRLDLSQPIADRSSGDDLNLDFGPFKEAGVLGVDVIKENLEKAAADDRIKGLYINSIYPPAGYANLLEIREAIEKFKESGKWVLAYNEVYAQKGYFLASTADEIYMFPEGAAEITGYSANLMFFKNMLDKIGVEAQIIRGKNNKFKSAVEPFMNSKMSEANKEQTFTYLEDRWETFRSLVAKSRGLTPEKIDEITNTIGTRSAQLALENKMIDGAVYEDEFFQIMANKLGVTKGEDVEVISLNKYKNARVEGFNKYNRSKNEVAVLYANGEINSGESDELSIGSKTFYDEIKRLRNDKDVKAVVLRINSPGGSALASEVIWRELELLKKEKPLVVSMGNLAASGGYYIATPAEKIYANPNTITGSIGVFGILPNVKKLTEDKLGITFDGVKTHKFADLGAAYRPLSNEEYAIIQNQVEQTYSTFLERVANGRGLRVSYVDSIGQGRVWSGIDALELGLVDELGDLEDAIADAASRAELGEDFKVKGYPKIKKPIEKLLEELNMENVRMYAAEKLIDDPALVDAFKSVSTIKSMKGVQMRMPFIIED
ncbi:signal peptide peptidase SppA [Luteibaculum oceani]|uniref:Signal peptide peptidase SppA n=1 Tax=Luteibaculum oceani TaxID=1294296 RepID=A0A5C6V8P0_9FLAO|nr:signal peptide peptidase SppA [Luteibaculum oceani]TXC81763.1 signal peptide peptidase SppA [Luteibaculum oceani]